MTDDALTIAPLDFSEAEAQARFETLQRRLVPLWQSIQAISDDAQTIVVVPSINVDASIRGVVQQAYEERYLFLLLLLRQPRARLIYVTSQAIHPDIVAYYLDLLPGVISIHAQARLSLVTPLDGSARPLVEKVLARPRLVEHIRSLISDPRRAHLVPFNPTVHDRDLALRLGIPMYGADPRFLPLGTKSGARRIFADEGVEHPTGVEDLTTEESVVDAVLSIRQRRHDVQQVIVKLNEGVSGEGNATIDLSGLPASASATRPRIVERVRNMRFELAEGDYASYMQKLREHGGIAEERLDGTDFRSPSAQLRVTPLGNVELLSTHDQLLGGPTGQSYLGCRFPASHDYAATIMREAAKVGRRLAAEGVLGRFAIDFVAYRTAAGEWATSAIEINLRKGGTTHPFLTLQFLTDGTYHAGTGRFTTPRGETKCYVATDHLQSPAYRMFTHQDLFDLIARRRLHFDHTRQTGVVLHMLNALGERGLMGLTAVANDPAGADDLYHRAVDALDDEARLAARWS